jgi:uncharacterized protein YuzE
MSRTSGVPAASYVKLSEREIVRTIEVGDDVMIDLDWTGRPVGIETIGDGDWRDAIIRLLMAGEVRLVHGLKPGRQP